MKLSKVLLVVLLAGTAVLNGKIQQISSYERFNKIINNKQLCVAYFYHYVRSCKKVCANDAYKEQLEVFKAVSAVERFRAADITFITVNTALPKLSCVREEYSIITTPSFALFKDGDCLASVQGSASKSSIMGLIEEHVADDIDDVLAYKEERRKEELEANLFWYNYYGYPWYGYCTPWYGCGYYYNTPCCYPGYGNGGCGGSACFSFGASFCR